MGRFGFLFIIFCETCIIVLLMLCLMNTNVKAYSDSHMDPFHIVYSDDKSTEETSLRQTAVASPQKAVQYEKHEAIKPAVQECNQTCICPASKPEIVHNTEYIEKIQNKIVYKDVDKDLYNIDFHDSNWQQKYENVRQRFDDSYSILKPIENNHDNYVHPQYNQGNNIYSKLSFYKTATHSWFIGHYVMYNIRTRHLTFFAKRNEDINLKLLDIPNYRAWMEWGNFKKVTRPFPNNAKITAGSGEWIVDPSHADCIAHLPEAINSVVHYIYKPNEYPQINRIYFLRKCYGNPWRDKYMEFIKTIFTENHPLEIVCQDKFFPLADRNGDIFFDQIGIMGLMHHNGFGGLFASKQEANFYRAAVYKAIHYQPNYHFSGKLVVTVLSRAQQNYHSHPMRNFQNLNEAIYNATNQVLENHNINEQLQIILSTDILIAITGSGFMNCIFMLPGSAIIGLYPKATKYPFFSLLAIHTDVAYFPVFDYDMVTHGCENPYILDSQGLPREKSCLKLGEYNFYHSNPQVNLYHLMWTLEIAASHVKYNKYMI
ncbi:hypothetical protein WA158_007225 [Blastocystis sp. Blastoise]